MGRYGAELQKATTSTTVGVGSIEAPGASMRRIWLFDFIFSSAASPTGDNVYQFEVNRSTTAATGTAVTPAPFDTGDAAAVTLAKSNLTVQGANTAGVIPNSESLNQRNTFRWQAKPGDEIIIPATANAGVHINTPTTSGLTDAHVHVNFIE
jgi:hypothetical protein